MAVTDMFKSTIDSFKSVGGGTVDAVKGAVKPTYDAVKNVGGSAVNAIKPYAGKVLAKLNTAKPIAGQLLGSAYNAHKGLLGVEDMYKNGINGINATESLKLAGVLPQFRAPVLIGSIGGDAIAWGMGKYGEMKYGGDNLTNASRAFAKTMQKDAKGNYIAPDPTKQNDAGKDLTSEPDDRTPFEKEIDSGNLTGSPEELSIKSRAARGEISEEDAIKMLEGLSKQPAQGNVGLSVPAQGSVAQADPLTEIKNTLAQAKTEREKVMNPLQQESKMQLKDYSNNPFAAVMQLQQAVGQLAPYAAQNKLARENSTNLMNDAKNQSGLVELSNTLKNSDLAREKTGQDIQEGKIKLDQSKRLNDAMTKLGTLDDTTDPKGDKRKVLQETILTMLGKEPKDNYQILEVGGGTDPVTGLPLPKRTVVFDKSTGKEVSYAGGGEAGATTTQAKPKIGAIKNVAGKNYEYITSADGTGWHNDDGDLIENV